MCLRLQAGPLHRLEAMLAPELALLALILRSHGGGTMAENLEILNTAVSLLVRAALLAAWFSGRITQRYLRRLASRDVGAQARDRPHQGITAMSSRTADWDGWISHADPSLRMVTSPTALPS